MSTDLRRSACLAPLVLCLMVIVALGQSGISGFVPLVGQLADIDDVVVVPGTGQMIVARPASQTIGFFNPGSTPEYTPFLLPPVVCSALAIGPDGQLYFGDSLSGTVKRFDLTTSLVQSVAIGMHIPIDVAFDSFGNLFI